MNNRFLKWKTILTSLLISGHVYAQRPDFSLVGFATENGGTTGGAGGIVLTVSNYADLKRYAEEANTPYIIQISGTIGNGPDGGTIKVSSNKTIFGLGNNALLNGVGLTIALGTHNVIIQNIRCTMTGITTRVDKAGVYSSTGDEGRPQILTNGGDCIRLLGPCNNVWIDHCELFSENPSVQTNIDLYDGLIDITHEAAFVTISWCYIHDHHKCHLVGSSETDLFADRRITFHHNYYNNIGSRLPFIRGAVAHVFNNYMLNTHGGSESRLNACIKSEKNYFENSRNTVFSSLEPLTGQAEIMGNKEVNCTHPSPYPAPCTALIPYLYSTVLTNNVDSVKILVPLYAGVGKLQGTCVPLVQSSKAISLCFGDSTVLTGAKGSFYIWKEGNIQVGTDSVYKVKSPGSYTVELTDTLGCRAVSNVVTVNYASSITWYEDSDNDGKGDPGVQQTNCDQPSGYVTDNSDLCPSDPHKSSPGTCGCGVTEQSCMDCNGIGLGTASIDICGRCTGGNTGKTACVYVGEVETDACGYDGVFENTNLGFKGTGYINSANAIGASITFSIFSPFSGNGIISFRYADGTIVNHTANLSINEIVSPVVLSFPVTGAYTKYRTAEFQVALLQGTNNIELIANTANGLSNIDQVGYVSPGLSKDACLLSGINDISENTISAYPSPFYDQLMIEEAGNFSYRIYYFSGIEAERGSFVNQGLAGKNLASGLYVLEVIKGDRQKRIKIAKQ